MTGSDLSLDWAIDDNIRFTVTGSKLKKLSRTKDHICQVPPQMFVDMIASIPQRAVPVNKTVHQLARTWGMNTHQIMEWF